jgi:hypothetical protein
MSTTTDSHDWLQAIDDHPEARNSDLLGAYAFLGTNTGRTPEQVDDAVFRLLVLGFLGVVDISDDGRTYTYALRLPDKVAT